MMLRVLLPVAVATFAIDWLTKWYVLAVLGLRAWAHDPGSPAGRANAAADAVWGAGTGEQALAVLSPFLQFRMLWNPGINFGIGGSADARWWLIGLAAAISVGLVVWLSRKGRADLALGGGLVIGGALGNALDRLVYGAVADFLNMGFPGFDNPFSFNVADIAVFAGALWIVWRA